VAVNQAWSRRSAEGRAFQVLGEVGQSYPAACQAAAAAGYDGLAGAGDGVRAVLSGQAPGSAAPTGPRAGAGPTS
jgi:hypothetical protein